MTELKVRTRGGARAEGKPRVYFTCHPADFEKSFERICGDLFKAADCAVYYTEDMGDRLPEETRETDLGRMNLFVIPVSLKLLLEENRAMGEDFPFAREKGIPVLPIVLEPGLEPVYGRKDRFGALQYLDPAQSDPTAVPYEEKLKKYLSSVLLDDETVRRIRKAFDAYVFLSYRKKDRRQANELMRLIHADPVCRDIAVWFDEFLTPGESFRDAIEAAMKDSRLFLLLVTPGLLERNDRGEPNFVQATEYPMAREAGMDALPAELLPEAAAPTDREALFSAFEGLPEPLNVLAGADRERFLARLRTVAMGGNDEDPAHNYLIGLAYLEGVDVETDRERGLLLITAAGEAELPEAMVRLYRTYRDGQGVDLDYRKALYWAEKLAAYNGRELGEEHPDTLGALNNLAVTYGELGDHRKALEMEEKVYTLCCRVQGEERPNTLTALNNLAVTYGKLGDRRKEAALEEKVYALRCKVLGEDQPDTLTALSNLAVTYGELGDHRKALELQEKAYALQCRVQGEEHPDTLTTLNNLASTYGDLGDRRKALELLEKVYALRCRVLGEEHPDTLTTLNDLAVTCVDLGDLWKALELQEKVYDLRCGALGEEHPDTLRTLSSLASTCGELGDRRKALELQKKVYALRCKALGEEHPDTLGALNNLAVTYGELGDHRKALELQEKVYALRCGVLGEEHPDTLITLNNLASAYGALGNHRKAMELQKKAYPLCCRVLGEAHPNTLTVLLNLAVTYGKLGNLQKTLEITEKVYALQREVLGEEHPDTLSSRSGMAMLLYALGKHGRALAICDELAEVGARLPKASLDLIAGIYEVKGLKEKAKVLRRRTEPKA